MAAYTAYVAARLPALRRVAHLLCRDPHRADDVVQTTLTRLYVHWHRASAAADLDRYVDAMLVRAFLSEQRLAWTRVRLTGAPQETPGLPPAPATRDTETRAVIHTALTRIPPRQRAVLVLRFLCDLPVAEVARILNCSEGNIKSLTARGLGRLRELLSVSLHPAYGERPGRGRREPARRPASAEGVAGRTERGRRPPSAEWPGPAERTQPQRRSPSAEWSRPTEPERRPASAKRPRQEEWPAGRPELPVGPDCTAGPGRQPIRAERPDPAQWAAPRPEPGERPTSADGRGAPGDTRKDVPASRETGSKEGRP
ncbi:sigma-70 family RNA polymerase sigma factor [Streptomyces sp. DSM 44917]|uniref:Sigma-70 family RNA polymerase sigma factor n=1 Tax=Streptomyces boetiae TaxID=3075541 RepID=A0ABU2L3D1_9ACTN|nr:sigma-70 family RNA polymerase sigma factor [Streptomyces sp. DSM 44917]MDT0306027.1 sigma-70 family RNA polymerase sigma factor [Streptomyces sp. DSM 44917]